VYDKKNGRQRKKKKTRKTAKGEGKKVKHSYGKKEFVQGVQEGKL